ncbi:MAG: gamma-glutamylcyclotransferase family protein [Pseudomonadota bacterium]
MLQQEDDEFYFAYGANMSARYLANIRKVRAIETKPAIVNGYALIFNLKGVNFLEPGFANILANENEYVEGVVHRVKRVDLARILKSEPVEYKIIDIDATVDGRTITAKSLLYVSASTQTYRPSKRYLNILTRAATQHGLSEEYIARIKSTECVYYPVLSEVFGSVIYLAVRFNAK